MITEIPYQKAIEIVQFPRSIFIHMTKCYTTSHLNINVDIIFTFHICFFLHVILSCSSRHLVITYCPPSAKHYKEKLLKSNEF